MSKAGLTYYVYVLFRETGVPFYVGLGQGNRWYDHERRPSKARSHKNRIIARMRANGWTDIPKVKVREHLTQEQAIVTERALIAAIGRYPSGPLANKSDGAGATGWTMPIDIRAKIGVGNRGKKRSEAVRAHLAAINTGQKASPATRKKMSRSHKGIKRKPCSPETKRKISAALKGRTFTGERLMQARIAMESLQGLARKTLQAKQRAHSTKQGELQL
jgi:hypothetical protein